MNRVIAWFKSLHWGTCDKDMLVYRIDIEGLRQQNLFLTEDIQHLTRQLHEAQAIYDYQTAQLENKIQELTQKLVPKKKKRLS